tara:strand:- start:2385 stop:2621 length:237 start_codon:yes stop_codon:yes gene_type:complete
MPKLRKSVEERLAKAGERFDTYASGDSLLNRIVTATKPNKARPYSRKDFIDRVDRDVESRAKALKEAIDAFRGPKQKV